MTEDIMTTDDVIQPLTPDDTIHLTMNLDPDDFASLTEEINHRRGRPLPDGTSDRLGAIVGEICRDLEEYREKAAAWIVKADVRRALNRAMEKAGEHDVGTCVAVCAALDVVRRELGLEG